MPHIKSVRQKMQGAFNSLAPLFFNRKFSMKNKVLLYKTIIRPIASYAAPVWAYAARTNIDLLESKQNAILRKIRRGPTFIRNTTIQRDLGISSLRRFFHRLALRNDRAVRNLPNEAIAGFTDYDYSLLANRRRPKAVLRLFAD